MGIPRPIAPIEAPYTIVPPTNNRTLNPGQKSDETITVTIPKNFPETKFDVYILADTTASMTTAIGSVKQSAQNLLAALQGQGLDVAFGVGNYKDFATGETPFQHQLSPTTNAATTRAAINAWSASGGGDNVAEAQLFALDQVAEMLGGPNGWRSDATRILVWFGDAPGHEPICADVSGLGRDITAGTVAGKLASQSIRVIALSVDLAPPPINDPDPTVPPPREPMPGLDADPSQWSLPPGLYARCAPAGRGTARQARTIANTTGGIEVDRIRTVEVVSAILSAVGQLFWRIRDIHVQLRGGAAQFVVPDSLPFPLVRSISAAGLTIALPVHFEGVLPCSRAAQVFEGAIDVVVDNVVKASKTLTVTVPPCPLVSIQGSPGAAVERNALREPGSSQPTNRMSVFVRSRENRLRQCVQVGDPQVEQNWRWKDLDQPGTPLNDSPVVAVAAYDADAEFHDHLYAFVTGASGHLHEISWDGRQFSNWADDGQPFWQATVNGSPAAIPFRRQPPSGEDRLLDQSDRVANLVWGSDGLVYYRDYFGNWGGTGSLPNGSTATSTIGMIHRPFQFIYGYVVGNDGRLYVTRSTDIGRFATSWAWVDLGRPGPQTGLVFFQRPASISFVFENQHRMYTFAGAEDGNLWVHIWRGQEPGITNPDAGSWANQGAPAGARVSGAASVVTHPHGGKNQIYAFVRSDNNLHLNFWDAANFRWVWRDLGRPTAAAVRGDPAAVVCDHADRDPIYVFIRGENNLLYLCHIDTGVTHAPWVELGIDRR